MKYFLIILFSFAANAKVFTVSADWSCSRLDISAKAAKLPRSTKLSIIIDNKSKELKIIPDIFNNIELNGKDSIINSSSCVKRLLRTIQKALTKFNNECKSCSLNSSRIMPGLRKKILQSKYISNTSLPKLPRVYSGHSEYSSYVNPKLVNKFCSNKKMNTNEIIAISSLDFIDQMNNMILIDKNSFSMDCIESIKKTHEKFSFNKTSCKSNTCKSIEKKSDEKIKSYKVLIDNFQYAMNKEDINNLEANGYSTARPEVEDLILKNSISDPQKCNINHTVKVNRRYVSIYKYDDAISTLLDKSLGKMNQDCVREIVQSYIKHKEADRSYDLDLCNSNYCKERISIYHNNLLKLMTYNHSKEQVEFFCKNKPKEYQYDTFIKFWDQLDNVLECTELKVGESRALKSSNLDDVGHYHGLKRLSDKNFEATLAIDFVSSNKGQNEEMRKRVNECISKTSQYFKGPGGEQMGVKVITPSENKKRPEQEQLEVAKIDIAAKGEPFRSHSKKYKADISCEVITHELLHLMGLVDEYHEHSNVVYFNRDTKEVYNPKAFPKDKDINKFEKAKAYGCRSHSVLPSVMSSQGERFQESVKKQIACECLSAECTNFMKHKDNFKVSLFSLPDASKMNRYCSRRYTGAISLNEDYNFSGQHYKNVNYSSKSLSFEADEFTMSTNLTQPTLVSYSYTCNCNSEECTNYIKNYNKTYISKNKFKSRRFCFSGSKIVKDKSLNVVPVDTPSYSISPNGLFSFTTTPEMDSLLMPAHFEKMKWGSCSSKSTKYKTCAKYAYKSLDFQCADKPKYCNSDEGWLLSTK